MEEWIVKFYFFGNQIVIFETKEGYNPTEYSSAFHPWELHAIKWSIKIPVECYFKYFLLIYGILVNVLCNLKLNTILQKRGKVKCLKD